MSVEIKVPNLPESVTDAGVAAIHKQVGDAVSEGEILFELETDKIVLEVPSAVSGSVTSVDVSEGDTVLAGHLLMTVEEGAVAKSEASAAVAQESKPAATPEPAPAPKAQKSVVSDAPTPTPGSVTAGPSARRAMYASGDTPSSVPVQAQTAPVAAASGRGERRVPMSRLRARIAERLLDVQKNAAILTTFNEVNMQPVMDLRSEYKDAFEKKHGVRLGFMSFFLKAATEALKAFPSVNASIDGQDIVYHEYFDIGVAVSTERGLVVPIVRDVDQLSMAEIESGITDYALKARDGKLTMDDLSGGTFSVTNGGVFGSMLSTPILNPPQSAILGMHNIVKRPVVENDQVMIRPMMYLALSYDHRIVDGRESVQFLVKIKQMLEDPSRLLLNV